MQLKANKTAQFFISGEYDQVELGDECVILSSNATEEHIPFNVWNGKIKIHRGMFWGGLQFFAHQEQGIQQSWLVQGLPWPECRKFAHKVVAIYQDWHNKQCAQLSQYLPQWQQELARLIRLPSFLPHSMIDAWVNRVYDDLTLMGMTLEEAHNRLPDHISQLSPWILDTSEQLTIRNDHWISNERLNWEVLFNQIESSPLNLSQQYAVLLNDDHNLVLAGAGSGKTSVLTARVAYLLQSHLAQAEDILLVAFGRDAAGEMKQRLGDKIGLASDKVRVNTFHQLGLSILNHVEANQAVISPVALDDKLKQAWCIDWLKRHWMTPTNFKRWQKHLSRWPIAYLAGDDELGSHVENPKLISWLDKQLEQLSLLGVSKKTIQERLVDHPDYARLNSELALCWPCYQAWQQMLKDSDHIDFNIMISRATDYVKKGKFVSPWTYIMIDEYQDISPQRLDLIQALCEQKSNHCNLFAVGDDWQSIYQFAGSDVDLTTGFESRMPYSTVHHLDTTYRFNDKLGAVANQFIQQNPKQREKILNSVKTQSKKAVVISPSSSVEKILDDLNRKASGMKSVLLLGRNHYHKPELLNDWKNRFLSLQLDFMTCHASKGKEADFVIILSVDEGQFPAKVKALHLDGALTLSKDTYAFAEERRLFYVAMTRAREQVWVTHSGAGSVFVQELLDGDYPVIKQK